MCTFYYQFPIQVKFTIRLYLLTVRAADGAVHATQSCKSSESYPIIPEQVVTDFFGPGGGVAFDELNSSLDVSELLDSLGDNVDTEALDECARSLNLKQVGHRKNKLTCSK